MPPTFPDAPRVELKQPPLELVSCQVHFPLVLGLMNNQPPEQFQREVRSHYPVANRGSSGQGVVATGSNASQQSFWGFTDKDEHWTVSLGVDSLALETRQYPSFEQFVDRFLDLVAAVRRVYGIDFRERLGLRYQDRLCKSIQPFLPDDWHRLIRPQLLPLRDYCGVKEPQMSHTETRFFFAGDRMLTVRSAFFDRGYPGFEEDMHFLDFDCYTEKRREMAASGMTSSSSRGSLTMRSGACWPISATASRSANRNRRSIEENPCDHSDETPSEHHHLVLR